MIYPFVRHGLDILFVGLNPANTSSKKGHYFSTNPAFWNQLYDAGLITTQVNMNVADEQVFGSSRINANHWKYGVTDLVNGLAESNSAVVKPTVRNCVDLMQTIIKYEPKVVVLLHGKVIKHFVNAYMRKTSVKRGNLGKLVDGCDTVFFNVPFPHGNSIPSKDKIEIYKQVKETLESWNSTMFK